MHCVAHGPRVDQRGIYSRPDGTQPSRQNTRRRYLPIRALTIDLLVLHVLWGCAPVRMVEPAADHPANPQAVSAAMPPPSTLLTNPDPVRRTPPAPVEQIGEDPSGSPHRKPQTSPDAGPHRSHSP